MVFALFWKIQKNMFIGVPKTIQPQIFKHVFLDVP